MRVLKYLRKKNNEYFVVLERQFFGFKYKQGWISSKDATIWRHAKSGKLAKLPLGFSLTMFIASVEVELDDRVELDDKQ